MFHARDLRQSLRRLVLAAPLLLASPAAAQFDDYSWAFDGDPSGSFTVSSTQMHVVGPAFDACTTQEIFAHVTATAAQSGTVTATYFFQNLDGGFGWWAVEDPVYLLDGEVHYVGPGDFFDTWTGDVTFHVDAGETFGFGVQSLDCSFGPGVLDVSAFTFEPDAWQSLGHALAGSKGLPLLVGLGTLQPGTPFTFSLVDAKDLAPAWLVIGLAELGTPFKGGVLVPDPAPPGLVALLFTGPTGRIIITDTWPAGLPPGLILIMQYWIADPAGPQGYAASNAVSATLP